MKQALQRGIPASVHDVQPVASLRGEPPDFCSQNGALALKAKLEAYWRERGHDVMISLQNVGFHPAIRAARYDVRSDMVNGLPRVRRGGPTPGNNLRLVEPDPVEEYYIDDEFDD
jgi:hypothetical protein